MPSGVYIHTKKHRQNQSIARKRQWDKVSKEMRLNIMLPAIMSTQKRWDQMTKEERLKRVGSMLKATQALEARQKRGKILKENFAKMTKEERLNRTHLAIEANQTLEARQNKSEAQTKLWKKRTKEERTEFCRHWFEAGIIASQEANPSSIKKLIWKELDKLNIKYETQVPLANGRFIADIYVPIWGTIIECNGDYWHNYGIFPKSKIRDEDLEKYANKIGLKVVWLWEFDIRRDPKSALLKALNFAKNLGGNNL